MKINGKYNTERVEHEYNGVLTVIEGAELQLLKNKFYSLLETIDQDKGNFDSILISIVHTFQEVYGEDIVYQEELKILSTPDARKMDLFYKYILFIFAKTLYPNDNWEKIFFKNNTDIASIINEIITINPNIFVVGINFNAIIKKLITRNNRNKN